MYKYKWKDFSYKPSVLSPQFPFKVYSIKSCTDKLKGELLALLKIIVLLFKDLVQVPEEFHYGLFRYYRAFFQ